MYYIIPKRHPKVKVFAALPQEQFGFILAYNYVNRLSLRGVNDTLLEIWNLLKPGGVFLFTFTDSDLPENILMFDLRHVPYTPGRLIKAMIKDGASLEDVMNVLGGSFGGASEAAANTAEGGMKRLGIALAETKESIGAALIPIVEALMPHLIAFGAWAQENTKVFLIVAGAIGGIALTILALNAAMKVYAAAQLIVNGVVAIFNALLLANPITLVLLAVVAFIAILTALYFKFETVRKIVDTVFDAMLAGGKAVFDGLTTYFTGLYSVFKTLFNGIAALWNNTIGSLSFEFPDWVPGLGGKGFSVPNIPMLADGGIVTGPTLAMIGERGPEAVIPLSGRNSGMGGNYTINITGGLSSSSDIGKAVVNAIRQFNLTNGPANIQVA